MAEQKEVPYYASLKSNETNVRTGPSIKYPIQWVYKKEGWPVKVVATFEGWCRIEDFFGEAGWVHGTLLTNKRNVVLQSNGAQEVLRNPMSSSETRFIVESGVVAELDYCKNQWCQIEIDTLKGWVPEKVLWGVR